MSTPSKELLSAVFNTTVKNIELGRGQTEVKIYRENTSCLGVFNIYELGHKCKEWAFWNDYSIITRFRIPDIYREKKKIDFGFEIYKQDLLIEFSWWIDTEPEALFKACNYILENLRQ